MLEIDNLSISYGKVVAVEGVSLRVEEGAIACLLGSNGAGKTTTLNGISGLVPSRGGQIRFEGEAIDSLTASARVARGIVQVPEGRAVFPAMTVADNLLLGIWSVRSRGGSKSDLDKIYDLFPRLAERRNQHAGTLSGGEQQMLMIGRALLARPKLLLLDEPSLGLSPVLVKTIFDKIVQLNDGGLSMLIVEQNAQLALSVSSTCYVLENGEVVLQGRSDEMAEDPRIQEAYLGGLEVNSSPSGS